MDTEKRTLKVLEWHTVLEHLSREATSELGKERCLNAEIFSKQEIIISELQKTSEARLLLDHDIFPPLGGIRNITEAVNLAKIGQTLKNSELIDIANTIGASGRLKSFFSRYQEESSSLFEISRGLYEDKKLEESILKVFDDSGEVSDNASSELKRLKSSYKDQLSNLKNKLNSLINSAAYSKYLQEPVYTIRDERYVLPIKAEFKSNVKGIVHDSSSSGATLFIEPQEIVEFNNNLREIELKIDAEIKRILAELSSLVGNNADDIVNTTIILAEIDFVFAKARYSKKIKGIEPVINSEKFFALRAVRHPILITAKDNVVPNNIETGKEWNTLIITGSNTGGKTVILKTAGLCILMAKAGLHVPAEEASIYPFKNIFADIGDEQSVIQNLSTFSGHMVNIINVLNNVDNESLVLLDEIGAGTDPSEGSALAQAILENLQNKDANTIVTTHYGELKALAYTKKGFYNASVEFDVDSLAPTYRLVLGLPGKSNAITIAKNLGLEENIADNARNIYLTQKDPTGEILEGLQNTQQELSRNAERVESAKDEIEKLEKEYSEKLEKVNAEKKKTISVYKKKFEGELSRARNEIREILDEIHRTKSEKVSRRAMNKLNEIESGLREIIVEEKETLEPEYEGVNWDKIKPGDPVYIKELEQDAMLISLPDKNGNVDIQIGLMKSSVRADRVVKSGSKSYKAPEIKKKSYSGGLGRPQLNNTLDLRGMRVEDALNELDHYLDSASLSSLASVSIIHGHGTGVLREAVREYLQRSPYIAKFRAGTQAEGGDGITIADLA